MPQRFSEMWAALPSLPPLKNRCGFFGGLLGEKIQQSLSPQLMASFWQKASQTPSSEGTLDQMPFHYDLFSFSTRDFDSLSLHSLLSHKASLPPEEQPLWGWNVTAPYKQKVLSKLDWCSQEVQDIQAVNLIQYVPKEGLWKGWNTDWRALFYFLSQANTEPHRKALLYGAGGVAAAAAYALGKNSWPEVWITNRTPPRAHTLLSRMRSLFPQVTWHFLPWNEVPQSATAWTCLLQMSSAEQGLPAEGLEEMTSRLPLPLYSPALVIESVYYPHTPHTPFLRACQKENPSLQCFHGIDFLIQQATENWKLWNSE